MGKYEKKAPKKKSGKGFLIGMLVYALVILAAAAIGLQYLWNFMDAYEVSRPRNTIEAYMAKLDADYVCDRSQELIDSIDHKLQSEEACRRVIGKAISGGITYARKTSECTDTKNVYILRSGGKIIGQVELVTQGEERYGFTPWVVSSDSFDFSFLVGGTASITVPDVLQVKVGDSVLDESYITETGLQYAPLEEFYDEYDLPCKVTYTAGPILGEISLQAYMPGGAGVVLDPASDMTEWLDNCSPELEKELDAFCRDFIQRYIRYLTSNADTRWGYYYSLDSLLLPDSNLAVRVKNALSGLEFGQSVHDEVVSITVNRLTDVGNDRYFCDVTYEVDTLGSDYAYHRSVNNARFFLVRTADGLLAERLLSY